MLLQVKDDQTGTEQDWLAGEKDGKEGVFPAAYAAPVEAQPTNGFTQNGGAQDNFFASDFNQTPR